MQNDESGIGVDPEVEGDQAHGGQAIPRVSFNHDVLENGVLRDGTQGASGSFNLGKLNPVKPKKNGRRFLIKNRPNFLEDVQAHVGEESRPRKRPRSLIEGDDRSGDVGFFEGSGDENNSRGFEKFFFDLNSLAPKEPTAEVNAGIGEGDNGGQEDSGDTVRD
ncbi:hypothetical protein Hanom_Chr08g00754961 [Helianthus anomalus]